MRSISCEKLGRPCAGIGGKYVPAKNGFNSGVRSTDIGQPPEPVIACKADIYTESTSGRSSRSTLMHTKYSFNSFASCSSSKLSRSITWHQWQVLYPIERKIGLFSRHDFSNASSPHGYQSTGLCACWSRYGDFS